MLISNVIPARHGPGQRFILNLAKIIRCRASLHPAPGRSTCFTIGFEWGLKSGLSAKNRIFSHLHIRNLAPEHKFGYQNRADLTISNPCEF